jgi:hypothetical protein
MGAFADLPELGGTVGDGQLDGGGPLLRPEDGGHGRQQRFDMSVWQDGFEGVAQGDAMAACDRVDDANDAKVVAFGELMGGESAVIEQPHAELQRVQFGRQSTQVDRQKRLRKLSLKVIEQDLDLPRFFEPQTMCPIRQPFQADPIMAEISAERRVAETAVGAERMLRD